MGPIWIGIIAGLCVFILLLCCCMPILANGENRRAHGNNYGSTSGRTPRKVAPKQAATAQPTRKQPVKKKPASNQKSNQVVRKQPAPKQQVQRQPVRNDSNFDIEYSEERIQICESDEQLLVYAEILTVRANISDFDSDSDVDSELEGLVIISELDSDTE